jgi:hypothetical protein
VGGGAARVYYGEALFYEVENEGAAQWFTAPSTISMVRNQDYRFRIEYVHGTGASALDLKLSAVIPPYTGTQTYYLNAGGRQHMPVHLPLELAVDPPSPPVVTAPGEVGLSGAAAHPDGIASVEFYVDRERVGSVPDPVFFAAVSDLPVNAEVAVRAVDLYGYGLASNVAVAVQRETLEDWLARHGVGDPDSDGDFDGQTAREEFGADTNPTNGASVFAITGMNLYAGGSNRVHWTGAESGLVLEGYELEVSTDVAATEPPGGWAGEGIRIPVSPGGSNSAWHLAGGEGNHHSYRIRALPR